MVRFLKTFLLFFAMTGCDGARTASEQQLRTHDWDRLEILARCMEHMSFPKGTAGGYKLDLENGLPRKEHIKLYHNGQFSIKIPYMDPKRTKETFFGCDGNFKSRTLEFVELNGSIKRPQPGQNWSY